jgi:hypothetical protein
MRLAKECSRPGLIIHILQHHYSREGNAFDVPPPIAPFNVAASHHRRSGRTDFAGSRVPDHGWKTLEEAAEGARRKAFVQQSHPKGLNRIGNGASIEGAKPIQLIGCQRLPQTCTSGSSLWNNRKLG